VKCVTISPRSSLPRLPYVMPSITSGWNAKLFHRGHRPH